MFRNIFNMIIDLITAPIEKETLWEVMNRFIKVDDENDAIVWHKLKDNINCSCVIELKGKQYNGLSSKELEEHFGTRLEIFKNLPDDIIAVTHSTRTEEVYDTYLATNNNKYINRILKKWDSTFSTSFKTNHYIVISTANVLGANIVNVVDNQLNQTPTNKKKQINEVVSTLLNGLKNDFEPMLLEKNELVSFFTSFINGKELQQNLPDNKMLDNILIESTIKFPKNENYMIYDNNQKIYSKWLSIKLFDNKEFKDELMEELMSHKANFSVYQTFQKYDKQVADKILNDKLQELESDNVDSEIAYNEIKDIKEGIKRHETSLHKYSIAIQVKNTNLAALTKNVDIIKSIIAQYGYRCFNESENIEPLYWSILPSNEELNSSKRDLISQNITALNTFTTISQGLNKCSWGNTPVVKFHTVSNTNYNFTFHNNSGKDEKGHTLLFGGTGVGKTLLFTWLATNSMAKYKHLKVIGLDKLYGTYVWTDFMDGDYIDFADGVGFNPMQMEDTTDNKAFLKNFFIKMTGKKDAVSETRIENAIDVVFRRLKNPADRNLKEFYNALGTKESDEDVVACMHTWVYGANKEYFGAKHDSLSFGSQINMFAMDTILSNPKVAPLISLYMLNAIKNLGTPVLIFIDEILGYLKNEDFVNEILELLVEIRKKDGVLVMAGQDYKFFELNEVGKQLLGSSLAKTILWPEKAKPEYQEALSLSDNQFKFITTEASKRKILVKNLDDNSSTTLNIDLKILGKDLNIFSSSSRNVQLLNELKISHPEDYKERYLDAA
ncbi:MAG: hypothetical protein DRG78_00735 [Epsilonproteobacteria bacterium]|nr:MAG: hypothetical protein DRG78_00735 [Campylobacterota bacterium]